MSLELDLRNGLYEFHHIGKEYGVGPGYDVRLFKMLKQSKMADFGQFFGSIFHLVFNISLCYRMYSFLVHTSSFKSSFITSNWIHNWT